MPIETGSWTNSFLRGRPRLEYICIYGHGTLKVPEEQVTPLRRRVRQGCSGGELAQPVAVELLPADHGAVELPLRSAVGTLETDPPRQFLSSAELQPPVESGSTAATPRERAAGPDPGWVEGERAEHLVDVVGAPGSACSGGEIVARKDGIEGRREQLVFVLGQPDRHGGERTRATTGRGVRIVRPEFP